jgi:predicted nucleic acid-binding protein
VIVLDTSILVDHLRGRDDASTMIDDALARNEVLVASVLTKVELFGGMRARERRATDELIATLEWIGVSEEIADGAGALARRYRASHPGVDVVDYVVASTTTQLGAALWTRNVKHFPMFEELRAPY